MALPFPFGLQPRTSPYRDPQEGQRAGNAMWHLQQPLFRQQQAGANQLPTAGISSPLQDSIGSRFASVGRGAYNYLAGLPPVGVTQGFDWSRRRPAQPLGASDSSAIGWESPAATPVAAQAPQQGMFSGIGPAIRSAVSSIANMMPQAPATAAQPVQRQGFAFGGFGNDALNRSANAQIGPINPFFAMTGLASPNAGRTTPLPTPELNRRQSAMMEKQMRLWGGPRNLAAAMGMQGQFVGGMDQNQMQRQIADRMAQLQLGMQQNQIGFGREQLTEGGRQFDVGTREGGRQFDAGLGFGRESLGETARQFDAGIGFGREQLKRSLSQQQQAVLPLLQNARPEDIPALLEAMDFPAQAAVPFQSAAKRAQTGKKVDEILAAHPTRPAQIKALAEAGLFDEVNRLYTPMEIADARAVMNEPFATKYGQSPFVGGMGPVNPLFAIEKIRDWLDPSRPEKRKITSGARSALPPPQTFTP